MKAAVTKLALVLAVSLFLGVLVGMAAGLTVSTPSAVFIGWMTAVVAAMSGCTLLERSAER